MDGPLTKPPELGSPVAPDDVAYPFFRGLLASPDCSQCPLRGGKIIPPEGNPRARIALVGESPGYEDNRDGISFSGSTGRFLTTLLQRAGLTREEVWLSNSVLCRGRTVTDEHGSLKPDQSVRLASKHCRPRLMQELQVVRPKAIVGFGSLSVKTLYDSTATLKGRRGGIHILDLLDDNK